VGREEEIFECLTNKLDDFHILGGSSTDDNYMERNQQFFMNETMTNTIVALGIQSNMEFPIEIDHGLMPTGKKLNVTRKSFRNCAISQIDKESATKRFMDIVGWPIEFLDEFLYKRTFFYPLGFKKGNVTYPEVIGSFLGSNIVCGYRIQTSELDILYASGNSLLRAVDNVLNELNSSEKVHLGLGVSCAVRLGALGSGIFATAEKLKRFFGNTQFLVIYTAGEDAYIPKQKNMHVNETFCLTTFR